MSARALRSGSPWVGALFEAAIVATVGAALVLVLVRIGWVDDLRLRVEDGYLPIESPAESVVVVATDLSAVRAHGLQRRTDALATLTGNILDAGADLVVVDSTFGGLGSAGMEELVASGRVVIPLAASRIEVSDRNDPGAPWAPMPDIDLRVGQLVTSGDGGLVAGHTMLSGIAGRPMRCASLVGRVNGEEIVPSIDLVAWARARGLATDTSVQRGGVTVGGRHIRTGPQGCLRVGFYEDLAPDHADVLDAVDVVDGRFERRQVEGRVVYLGDTSPNLGAIVTYQTPTGEVLPAVFVHANVFASLSQGAPVSQSTTEIMLTGFVLAFVMTLLTLVLSPLLAVPLAVGASLAVYLIGQRRFASSLLMTDTLLLIGAVVVGLLAGLVLKGVREMARRRRVSDLFSNYVPPHVARQLVDMGHIEALLEGSRCDVAVLFVDICGFTRISGAMPPQAVRTLLDEFYAEVVPVVLAHGGTVVNLIGDEVYAVFGAPLPVEDHAQRALECAIEIQLRREVARASVTSDGAPAAVEYSIGVHVGDAVAAHVGNDFRRQYTIVGDTVNIGSRLCGRAGPGEVVFSEAVLDRLGDRGRLGELDDLGDVALKNVMYPIRLYSVRPRSSHGLVPQRPGPRESSGVT